MLLRQFIINEHFKLLKCVNKVRKPQIDNKALTKRQRANIDRFKAQSTKVPERYREEANKPAESWWIKPNFSVNAKSEHKRMKGSKFGQQWISPLKQTD